MRPARSLTRVARLVQVPVGGQGLLLWLWLRRRCVFSFLEELLDNVSKRRQIDEMNSEFSAPQLRVGDDVLHAPVHV